MERVIQMTVDLECPDEAKFAIDTAVETYKQSKRQWSESEEDWAKDYALSIMLNLCKEGYNIDWTHEIVNEDGGCIMVWVSDPNPNNIDYLNGICTLDKPLWNVWVGKCVALCKATGQKIPEFITDKAGDCL